MMDEQQIGVMADYQNQGFSEFVFQPLKADEEQQKCGWDKQTIRYYYTHAQKIKKMIFNSAKMFNRPQLQKEDVEDAYQELGKLLYKSEDYSLDKACSLSETGEIIPIEVYISQCVKTCVSKFCQQKSGIDKREKQAKVFEDQDGKQSSQFDFVEDTSAAHEFLRLDYDLRKLCESYECYRYKFGCDMFQLIYVRLLLIADGRYQDEKLYDSIMTVLGVSKKQLQSVERRQYQNDVFIQILKAANEIGFKSAVEILEDFVYGARDIKQAVMWQK